MPQREDYRIRSLEERDLEKILEWRNLERVRSFMYTDHIIPTDEHRAWYQRVLQDKNGRYLIFEFQRQQVGFISCTNIDWVNGKCYWAYYLGEIDTPRGTGAVMEFFALEYIFEELKVRKLCCEVFEFNASVIKLHNKFGFTEEGGFIKHILKNGHYENVISLALFKDQWLEIKNKYQKMLFR